MLPRKSSSYARTRWRLSRKIAAKTSCGRRPAVAFRNRAVPLGSSSMSPRRLDCCSRIAFAAERMSLSVSVSQVVVAEQVANDAVPEVAPVGAEVRPWPLGSAVEKRGAH
jgi:hypothetical protein